MSSFIVDDKTINSIVFHITRDKDSHYVTNKFSTGELVGKPKELGEEMYKLNLVAVEDRYGDYAAMTMGAISKADYSYRAVNASPIQTLKNLQCWLYQCSEGEVPGSTLYKMMEAYASELAKDIVRALPEYDLANWG